MIGTNKRSEREGKPELELRAQRGDRFRRAPRSERVYLTMSERLVRGKKEFI